MRPFNTADVFSASSLINREPPGTMLKHKLAPMECLKLGPVSDTDDCRVRQIRAADRVLSRGDIHAKARADSFYLGAFKGASGASLPVVPRSFPEHA